MLRLLSGGPHVVLSAVCIVRSPELVAVSAIGSTEVRFKKLSEAEISWYVATGEGMDKAGGYAIQGFASIFITGLTGSYSNVVGLPTELVYQLLHELGHDHLNTSRSPVGGRER